MLALIPLIGPIIERLAAMIPDPEARARAVAQAQTEALNALSSSDASQAATNTSEAQHPSVFVAGARPAFMWLCVVLVAWSMALRDLTISVVQLWVPHWTVAAVPTDELWTLTFGLLGLSALRTFEKARGVETTRVSPAPAVRR